MATRKGPRLFEKKTEKKPDVLLRWFILAFISFFFLPPRFTIDGRHTMITNKTIETFNMRIICRNIYP